MTLYRTGLVALSLVVATHASAAIDVGGSWQVNIDCGFYGTATTFLDIDEDLGTGDLTVTTPECGTLEVPGAIVAIDSCVHTPTPRTGVVNGTAIDMPESGYFGADSTFVPPFPFPFFGCPAARVVSEQHYAGSIVDDGGVAVAISGPLLNGALEVYEPDGSLCLSLADTPDCSFEMLRNEVAAGTNVTVQPRGNATVTFEMVTAAGRAGVVPLTTAAAAMPSGFQIIRENGGDLYYDVRTTASIAGAITTCLAYPDGDQNGVVDGTSIPETDVQILHEEGADFVDRTVLVDPVANVACAETTTLSQVVIGGAAGPPPPPSVPCSTLRSGCRRSLEPIKGKLTVNDKSPDEGDLVSWKWIKGEATSFGELGSPTVDTDYGLCIFDVSGASPIRLLDAMAPGGSTCGTKPCWKQLGTNGFKYTSRDRLPDGIRKMLLRAGPDGKARIIVKGGGPDLDPPTAELSLPLRVQVQASNGSCWEAGFFPAGVKKNENGRFYGKAGSPSGAFVD